MIFFIRNDRDETIAACEVYNTDEFGYDHTEIKSSVAIDTFSEVLLSAGEVQKSIDLIKIFSYIQELNDWLWHSYYAGVENDGSDLDELTNEIRKMFQDVAEKFELNYAED